MTHGHSPSSQLNFEKYFHAHALSVMTRTRNVMKIWRRRVSPNQSAQPLAEYGAMASAREHSSCSDSGLEKWPIIWACTSVSGGIAASISVAVVRRSDPLQSNVAKYLVYSSALRTRAASMSIGVCAALAASRSASTSFSTRRTTCVNSRWTLRCVRSIWMTTHVTRAEDSKPRPT